PCVTGEPGGLVTADKWLQQWVPKILSSPAFKKDGLLVVTFDEAEAFGGGQDASACCGEGPQVEPNTPMPGIFGPGGGRVGAVLVSPFIHGGSFNDTAYNHYGLLCSIEDVFGLEHLGYAATTERCFGTDVYNKGV
ncbi:MAG: alkaline phosphatase family protein, partial [Mycobacteriales bacterium]